MVEETIQAIKETEKQAENILADAKARQKEILEKAQQDAIHLKEEYLAGVKAKAGQDMDAVQSECSRRQSEEQQKMDAEVDLLKEMALRKKEEAMALVMEALI